MLLASLVFILILGSIAYIAVTASLFATIPFFPYIFPAAFVVVCLPAISFSPRLRTYLLLSTPIISSSQTGMARIKEWAQKHFLFLIFVPIIILLLFLPALQFSYHGLFHSGYVYSVFLHGLPPENVTLPGYPANDYWPYHVYLALLTQLLNAPPPFVSAVSNILVMGMAFLWMAAIWRSLAPSENTPSAFLIIFPLFGANLFYALNVIVSKWVHLPLQWNPDNRLDLSLSRFINFNGFSLGILLFLVALYVALRLLREDFNLRDGILLIFLSSSALLFHATTGIFLFAVLIPCLIAARVLDRSRPLPSVSSLTRNWSAYAIGILLLTIFLLPIGIFLLRSAGAMGVKTTIELFSPTDISSVFVVVYPMIIPFIIGLKYAWKEPDVSFQFLSFVALLGFLLAIIIKLPDGNEYKFIYLSSITLNIVALIGLKKISVRSVGLGKALMAVGLVALVYNIAFGTWATYDVYSRRHKAHVTYQQTHVIIEQSDFDPFLWIRENTPSDTVIIQPLTSKDWNYGYFSERLPYVVAGHIYNKDIPETAVREHQIDQLYDLTLSAQERIEVVRAIMHSLDRPIAILYSFDSGFNTAMQQSFKLHIKQFGQAAVVYYLDFP